MIPKRDGEEWSSPLGRHARDWSEVAGALSTRAGAAGPRGAVPVQNKRVGGDSQYPIANGRDEAEKRRVAGIAGRQRGVFTVG